MTPEIKARIRYVPVTDRAGRLLGMAQAWVEGECVKLVWDSDQAGHAGPVLIRFGTLRDGAGRLIGINSDGGY